jgi:DnaJ-class molecular chaperone
MDATETCEKCKGKGVIKEKDGTVHICYDCLFSGRLDQHNSKIKDASDLGIKL